MEARARFDDLVVGRAFELRDVRNVLVASTLGEVQGILDAVEDSVTAGQFAAGFVTYEAAPAFDSALTVRDAEQSAVPLAWFALFSEYCEVDPVRPPEAPVSGAWTEEMSAPEHEKAVQVIKDRIRAGWTYQVNLTTALAAPFTGDSFELYRQLATAQHSAYNAYLEGEGFAIACSSPELFFTMGDGTLVSRPMKGTALRGRFPEEDARRAEALRTSAKERAENVMIVDLIRNDVGRVSRYGSVEVPELCSLERYPTVWQLSSEVTGSLAPDVGLAEVFAALFPCGSVTGAPKASTMGIIAELESSPRGVYCGAVGSVLPSEHGPTARFAVGIRTATIDRRAGVASYGVGGGITNDSTPAAEWNELHAKAKVLTLPPRRFGLLETFRYEEGAGFVNLERHLERMERSADHFMIEFDRVEARRLLEARTAELPRLARVRLSLVPYGSLAVEDFGFVPDTAEPFLLAIDDVPVDRFDERLFHKTTDRTRYDEAMARHPGVDDVILVNAEGEVTETTRANLVVLLDGRWWTPAQDSGLLAGIGRECLLESGTLVERTITPSDLRQASALATISSLRGWHEATLFHEAR